jgi:hypothetical protein
MELTDTLSTRALRSVGLGLTESEARDLVDVLSDLLERGVDNSTHHHVSSSDYQTELTVWLAGEE